MWEGYGPEDCTWEPEASFRDSISLIDDYWKTHALKTLEKENRRKEGRKEQPRQAKRAAVPGKETASKKVKRQ